MNDLADPDTTKANEKSGDKEALVNRDSQAGFALKFRDIGIVSDAVSP